MWVRVGSFSVKPGTEALLRATYNAHAVPRVRAQPNNVGCLLLEPEVPGGHHLVLTLWRDRAAADAYEASGAAAEVVGLVRGYFAGPPKLESFESSTVAGLAGT